VVFIIGFALVASSLWAPAHPGIDQNGYLVGGKNLADHFSSGFLPADPFEFVGGMWIRTDTGWYYPKYPLGLPLLNAMALWLDPQAGDPHGKMWVMMIAPICAVLSLVAMFLLVRIVAGSFLAVLGMILLGTSMTLLAVMNSPWSHAPALCFVTWGMYLMVRWWQTASTWRGVLAGLLLGYAVTIRYTEGLLLLPILLVAILMLDPRAPRTWLRAAIPVGAWLVPVTALVAFNYFAMGSWTGYDSTNESTGFTWKNFLEKWEFMTQQIYDYGLFFIAPLAVLGMAGMYRASWKLALLLTLWVVPGVVVYTSYYWGLNRTGATGVGYLRFFLTLFPPMIVSACWVMRSIEGARGSVAGPIACGLIVAIAASVGVNNSLPSLSREHAVNWNLAFTMDQITRTIPRGSVVFAESERRGGGGMFSNLLNFLQFKGDYTLYGADAFSPRPAGWRGEDDPDQPNPMQPARRKYLVEQVYRGKSIADLEQERKRIIEQALRRGTRVFAIVPSSAVTGWRGRMKSAGDFVATPLARWREPADVPAERGGGPLQPQNRGPGGPGGMRGSQSLTILEITLAPPTTQPG
jgi:hypothetical protein